MAKGHRELQQAFNPDGGFESSLSDSAESRGISSFSSLCHSRPGCLHVCLSPYSQGFRFCSLRGFFYPPHNISLSYLLSFRIPFVVPHLSINPSTYQRGARIADTPQTPLLGPGPLPRRRTTSLLTRLKNCALNTADEERRGVKPE